jgi:hypothetical protein
MIFIIFEWKNMVLNKRIPLGLIVSKILKKYLDFLTVSQGFL